MVVVNKPRMNSAALIMPLALSLPGIINMNPWPDSELILIGHAE